ncbi:MAG: thioredoxin family protein [Polyangiaceae bacterium]
MVLSACAREPRPDAPARTTTATPSGSVETAPSSASVYVHDARDAGAEPRPHGALRVVAGEGVEVASFIRAARARALREGRKVVVEVGASWCKPCRTLAAAVDRGELDEVLADVTILAFDADAHGARLDSLGYRSKFVPFFAVPNPDGSASDRRADVKVAPTAQPHEIAAPLAPLLH